MSKLRFDVVQDAFKKRALDVTAPAERPSAYFGELVFNREKMHKYLDVKTYEALVDCIDNGRSLDLATADKVAEGMKSCGYIGCKCRRKRTSTTVSSISFNFLCCHSESQIF